MHVVLTGATGFLGNNVLRSLLAAGHEVTCLIRQSSLPESLLGLQIRTVTCSLHDQQLGSQLPAKFDLLIHCAAQIQIGRTQLNECRVANVDSTRNLAAICCAKGCRMVHVSTVDTLGYSIDGKPLAEGDHEPAKPPMTYVVTKREAERVFRQSLAEGLDGVVVHPGFMLGRYDWRPSSAEMFISVARLKPPFAPAGGCSLADVRDVAAGVISAASRGRKGEHYILGGHNIAYRDLWDRMARLAGVRPPRWVLPDWMARVGGSFGDLKTLLTRHESNLNSMAAAMGQLKHYYSSAKAETELGYCYRNLEETLLDSWNWIVERGWLRGHKVP